MVDLLSRVGRYGRWMLVVGLLGGLLFPAIAGAMRAILLPLIAAILFLSVLRVEPHQIRRALAYAGRDIPVLLALQLLLPIAAAGIFWFLGFQNALSDVLILTAAAAPIAGGAGLATLTGLDGMVALRLLVWGTVLLPLTSMLPLQIVFADESMSVLGPALRLLGVIVVASGLAILVRRRWHPDRAAQTQIDGLSAILLAALVLGLMDAIQPVLLSDPGQVARNLVAAFAVNVGLQVMIAPLARRAEEDPRASGSIALMAGNRNLGLFLVALPPASMDAMMVFVGCYQVPMFLTPILMRRFYGIRG